MTSLQERLLSIEDDFLSALSGSGDALSMFEQHWEKLQEDLDAAFCSGELDTSLSMLAHSIASRIATLADTSIELLIRKDTITDELVEEVESLMAQIDLIGTVHFTNPPTLSPPKPHLKRSRGADETTVHSPKRRRAASYEMSSLDTPSSSKPRRFSSEPCGSKPLISSLRGEGCSRPAMTTSLPISQLPSPTKASLGLTTQATRKRRRSDVGLCSDQGSRKKQHVGPRLHAVSDSFISCMDTNTPPFPRHIIQTDPSLRPNALSPSHESVFDQRSLLQDCSAPIVDIHHGFEIDSLFALDPSPFTHLDDFLNTFVDVNTEIPTTHVTSSNDISSTPQKEAPDELSLCLFNIPSSPLSSSSVSSSPISTPSYPLTPRLDAVDTDSLHDDPPLHSLPHAEAGLPSPKALNLDTFPDTFPPLAVDDQAAISSLDIADVWGTILCSTPLVQLPVVSSSQVGCWNAQHACKQLGDMLGLASSVLSPIDSDSIALSGPTNATIASHSTGLSRGMLSSIPLIA